MTHSPAPALVEAFARSLPFPLDEYQIDALTALAEDRSVLVTVPTGAGKTVVAEFALWLARRQGHRAIYTTPLKALSNQKYRDLQGHWPGDVGLCTGDVTWHPEAPIQVMTTEVLRNRLLLGDGLPDVAQVILDEAHFLADRDRGTVWEETIMLMPGHVQLTALSATLANADELAGWMSRVHRPVTIVDRAERPVPLIPYVASHRLEPADELRAGGQRPKLASGDWQDPVRLAKELQRLAFLPAIVFTFSRHRCETQVAALADAGVCLTDGHERQAIADDVARTLAGIPELAESRHSRRWLDILALGVAPHHAGLLPEVKLLVERLFQRGLIKLVYATETLAAGINMPARCVVLSRLLKPSSAGDRALLVTEYRQMAGRAGRRGIDPVGYVVLIPEGDSPWDDIDALLDGDVEPVWSQFRLTWATAAQLYASRPPAAVRHFLDATFAQYQAAHRRADLRARLAEVTAGLAEWSDTCPYRPGVPRAALLGMYDRIQERVRRRPRRSHGPQWQQQAIEANPCTACRERTACQAGVTDAATLVATQGVLRRQLAEIENQLWHRYERLVDVLTATGFIGPDGLSPAGTVLAGLRTEQDLAAAIAWGYLDEADAAALAAIASAVVGTGARFRTWSGPAVTGTVRPLLDRIAWDCESVAKAAIGAGLSDPPPQLDESAAGLVQQWAEGHAWRALIDASGIDEGELVWHLRQVIDLLGQYAETPATAPAVRDRLRQAAGMLDRGVVRVRDEATPGA